MSVRFGGLIAVDGVDLTVKAGKVTSVIGPNGAGKTTLFNCISGVLSPAIGVILLGGRDCRRAWRWRTTIACVGISLLTAAFAGGLTLNVDGLWRAAIRRPNNFSDRPFTWRAAVTGITSYLRGELAVERASARRWNVVTADGGTLFATLPSRGRAEEVRNAYERLRRSRPAGLRVIQSGDQWLLPSADKPDQPLLASSDERLGFATREAAFERLNLLVAVERKSALRWRLACAACLAGVLVGSLGVVSVWKRSRWTPEVVAADRIARTFQNLRLFTRMTSLENVLVALENATNDATDKAKPSDRTNEARRLLGQVGLASVVDRPAGALAYGDRRRLEIARALALRPRLLLLDEPAAGMNAGETARLKQLIRQICDSGVSIVLIDHEMTLVMGISDHVVVLANGRKIAEGTPEEVRRQPAVVEAYLGT